MIYNVDIEVNPDYYDPDALRHDLLIAQRDGEDVTLHIAGLEYQVLIKGVAE